jgi:hypothetical protein
VPTGPGRKSGAASFPDVRKRFRSGPGFAGGSTTFKNTEPGLAADTIETFAAAGDGVAGAAITYTLLTPHMLAVTW